MQATQNPEISSVAAELSQEDSQQKRKRMFKYLGMALAVIATLSYGYWSLIGSKHITTDNAYAAADVAQVTASVAGIVKSINVIDTQTVKAGEALVVLDNTDATLTLKQAEANFLRNNADWKRTQSNFERRQKLAGRGFVSAEELNNFQAALAVAKASADLAAANLDQARIDLDRTVIRAPFDGVVAKREVELGQRIAAGAYLLTVIPTSKIYVNANFKEVQLTNVKVGQSVELRADLYGSSVKYHGRVEGVSAGTGAAFAMIPAQNATGNWIKVVQRLPVRIALDPKELAEHPLQVGLSMHADINIGKNHS